MVVTGCWKYKDSNAAVRYFSLYGLFYIAYQLKFQEEKDKRNKNFKSNLKSDAYVQYIVFCKYFFLFLVNITIMRKFSIDFLYFRENFERFFSILNWNISIIICAIISTMCVYTVLGKINIIIFKTNNIPLYIKTNYWFLMCRKQFHFIIFYWLWFQSII